MTVTAISTVVFYPSLKNSNIGSVFNSLPTSVQHLVGTGNGFNTISGYVSQEVFGLRAPLLTIILAIITFNSLTVSEERKGILETYISLPLSRARLYFAKTISGLLIVFLSSLGLLVGTLLALTLIHEHYAAINVFHLVLSSILLGVDFGLVALALYGIFGVRSIVLGLTCVYAFASYLLNSFASSVHSLAKFQKFSLFNYYQYSGAYSVHDITVLSAIAAVLIFIGYIFFRRRDIAT